MMKYTYCRFF